MNSDKDFAGKDFAGDYKGLNDVDACGFDDADTGCEKSVGFHPCFDSNGVWYVIDLGARMLRVGTNGGCDYHRMCSWLDLMPPIADIRSFIVPGVQVMKRVACYAKVVNRLNREFETKALNCVTNLNTLPNFNYLECQRHT